MNILTPVNNIQDKIKQKFLMKNFLWTNNDQILSHPGEKLLNHIRD